MGDEILKKLDMFIDGDASEASVYNVGHPNQPTETWKGVRPIQFLHWWGDFRPGDRVDVMFAEDFIQLAGTNAEGYFAGIKKEAEIVDPMEMEEFKGAEGTLWNFV